MTLAASPSAPLLTTISESELPLKELIAVLQAGHGAALAVITEVVGASYRPLGAAMLVESGGKTTGNLSSGCIERDVAHHALAALESGESRRLRYGAGSPFIDLELPCGGGLEILVLPRPDLAALQAAQAELTARRPALLSLGDVTLKLLPELRFLVFGKGPEARALAQMAQAAGYLAELFSPDEETLAGVPGGRLTPGRAWPEGVRTDPRSAVALFFHEHDREPPLLAHALRSDAFYIGAQGSARARAARLERLQELGLSEAETSRMAVPFGLVASVRDPRSLAISVLAQVLEEARRSDS